MPQPGLLIVETSDGFRWTSLASGASRDATCPRSNPAELAADASRFVQENGLDRNACVIAIATESTLFARFPVGGDAKSRDSDALRFRLESELPVDAENTIADFVFDSTSSPDPQVSAMAIVRDEWLPLVENFEAAGLQIQFIVPKLIIRLQDALRHGHLDATSVSLWSDAAGDDLVRLQQGVVTLWRRLPHDEHRIAAEIRFLIEDGVLDSQSAVDSFGSRDDAGGLDWIETAADYLSRKAEPWVQLRRDVLTQSDPFRSHRRELRRAIIATIAAVCVALFGFWWRASHHDRIARQEDDRVRNFFREALPGKRVPAAVLTGLRSAKRNLLGIGSASRGIEPPVPAMDVLGQLLVALPDDLPVEVSQFRIENGGFVIEVDVATIEDAGKLAAALQEYGMTVSPPSTIAARQNRVRAQIEGRWRPTNANAIADGGRS